MITVLSIGLLATLVGWHLESCPQRKMRWEREREQRRPAEAPWAAWD